mmetsp:Transcript_22837/g.49409  ORF Transcript_22837/g.49409 Transcript_22837/m.49409 type:complete len:350 (+) Transcript_22837:126-1175(+)|eukprot:CAMPEP_0172318568 /NCGR_PEP_ID=MMETSP1058-20130122/35233_1 /TAXON_ID=83371 /ORGANISM="Detonula confervacea, Strain CCMP 353" /LENGTH=349 /DNA_ID=CAMNT_0013033425 /DNA_START=73 /DNA_END=1122 /DNA_ORIENTATION=+
MTLPSIGSASTTAALLLLIAQCHAFTTSSTSSLLASSSTASSRIINNNRLTLFASQDDQDTTTKTNNQLFDSSTLAEANDALASVGWGGVAPNMEGDGELTSEDPFVKQIDESIRGEMGVGLDELLNPAKVVNLERDLYNLRNELATLTGATLIENEPLTTILCDAGGGGEEATAIRAKIDKKEKDLATERRAVFRGWLKNVFLGQAVFSMALSYVMATNPDVLFSGFSWYHISNMDTSIMVLGFWWWWLFIVPSLRSRRPSGFEKKALDIAFLGTPLISLLSPVVTKDTGIIWCANFAVVAGAYGFAYLVGDEDGGDDGEGGKNQPEWIKFLYKSLDFGSGRERGARN